ncbi:MAG: carboxymuconolactone decarboxylase family protein [Desulfobaccales bacterium]
MARLPDPMAAPTPAAAELYDQLAARRGQIDGMYRSLLNHPELTRHVSDLGTYLRFGSGALPADLRELAILWVARQLNAAYEWVKHTPPAHAAGLPEELIEAVRTGMEKEKLSDTQTAVIEAAGCVLARRSINQDLQDRLLARLGLEGLIELVVLCGFYQMIAGVIFAFDVPLPAGAADPFV